MPPGRPDSLVDEIMRLHADGWGLVRQAGTPSALTDLIADMHQETWFAVGHDAPEGSEEVAHAKRGGAARLRARGAYLQHHL